jgi:hypothetical protein
MGDPITAGAVGSVVAPSFGAAVANPLTASMAAGAAGSSFGGGSLFGFETPFSGIGRVIDPITSAIGGANTWMNQNPITSRVGMELAQSLLSPEQQRMASAGASVRPGGQIQPADYMSLLNPQQQKVLRPATPSLI